MFGSTHQFDIHFAMKFLLLSYSAVLGILTTDDDINSLEWVFPCTMTASTFWIMEWSLPFIILPSSLSACERGKMQVVVSDVPNSGTKAMYKHHRYWDATKADRSTAYCVDKLACYHANFFEKDRIRVPLKYICMYDKVPTIIWENYKPYCHLFVWCDVSKLPKN